MSPRPAPPPGPAKPFDPPRFSALTLPSGLSVRAARWGKRPTVALSILFPGAGSAADPRGREGLAEVAAESFLSGTRFRPARALAEALDDLAAVTEVSAGFDAAVARLFVLETDLDEALDLLAEILATPAFDPDEVDKIRGRHLDLLAEQRSEPDFLARERLLERLYPGDPYGRLAATEEGLSAIGAPDVVAFWRNRFFGARATVVLAGPGDPAALAERAARRLWAVAPGTPTVPPSALPPPASPSPGLSVHLVRRPGSAQAAVLFGRRAIRRSDSRWLAALAASHALGGGVSARLFRVLREERALTYGTYASLLARTRSGYFVASIDARHDAAAEAVNGLLDLVRAFADEGPAEAELRRAVDFLAGSFALARETPGAVVEDEAGRILHDLPEDESRTWRDRLRAVTLDEAREASRLFHPSEGVLVAVGDPGRLRPVLSPLGPMTEWEVGGLAAA